MKTSIFVTLLLSMGACTSTRVEQRPLSYAEAQMLHSMMIESSRASVEQLNAGAAAWNNYFGTQDEPVNWGTGTLGTGGLERVKSKFRRK